MSNHIFTARGKRVSDGAWVYGDYNSEYCAISDISKVSKIDGLYSTLEEELAMIYPKTLGYSTGRLADKSHRGETEADRMIYSGDILEPENIETTNSEPMIVFWNARTSGFGLKNKHGRIDFWTFSSYLDRWKRHGRKVKIIGNKHDNPELLEV